MKIDVHNHILPEVSLDLLRSDPTYNATITADSFTGGNHGAFYLDPAFFDPKAKLADGTTANVIAWIWARTMTCPNPACGIAMPLARSFWLSKKRDRPTWLEPVIEPGGVRFEIRTGLGGPVIDGTVGRAGATCVACETPVDLKYIRGEGRAHRIGEQLMAVVAEGHRHRVYLQATDEQVAVSRQGSPVDVPETDLPEQALGFRVQAYGMTHHRELFSHRQLIALTTFSDLVPAARDMVAADAKESGLSPEDSEARAKAVAL